MIKIYALIAALALMPVNMALSLLNNNLNKFMNYLKEQVLTKANTRALTSFIVLAGIATISPFYLHLQWITGPIINAIFILALFLVGIRSALIICLVPSLMALSGGLIPAILAPIVPFIMIGNAIFVLSVERIYEASKNINHGYWLGVVVGSGVKFLFLFFSVNFITKLLIKRELATAVAQMMSWPQFATAVMGGMIAWVILKWLKRL